MAEQKAEQKLNIYQKLAKIRKQVEVMKRDTKAYGYSYTREESILAKITVFMEKYNLSLIPGIVPGTTTVAPYNYKKTKTTQKGDIYEENVNEVLVSSDTTWTWVNNDDPEERIVVPWAMVGQQSDASQSFGSGLTYSSRYFLLKYFNISTSDDDPDKFRSKQREAEAEEERVVTGQIIENIDKTVKVGIRVTLPKWGTSRGDYFFDRERNIIAKGLASVKYMSAGLAEELYVLAKETTYTRFMDILYDLDKRTSINSRQLEILIELDFFSDFGNQRELLRMVDLFNMFKKGEAKQIRKSVVDGTALEPIVRRYAVGVTKSGGDAKSYTLLDVMSILREAETAVRAVGMDDLSDVIKVRNFYDIMGYIGYVSGKEADRPKLYVTKVLPLRRKLDNTQFGYSVFTKSIGSGKDGRFTLVNRLYDSDPVREGDIIYCKGYQRDGQYFKLTAYEKIC